MKPQVCHTCGFSAQANTVLNQTGLILQGFGGVMRSNTAAMPCSQVSRALNCLTYAFHICRNCYAPKKRNLCRADIIAERNVPKARRSGAIIRWLSTGCLHARNRYAHAPWTKYPSKNRTLRAAYDSLRIAAKDWKYNSKNFRRGSEYKNARTHAQ